MLALNEDIRKVLKKKDWINITGRKFAETIFLVYEMIIFIVTLIRASVTQLTFDEADTFGTYCKEAIFTWTGMREEFSSSIANNHLLNTYLITLFQMIFKQKYSEFLIRMPALLFLAAFLTMVFVLLHKQHIPMTVAFFMISNYYVSEFYGLARGYAMANTLVFAACASYLMWRKKEYADDKYLVLCSFFLAAAASANTVVLLLMPSFGVFWLVRLLQGKRLLTVIKKHAVYLVLFMGFLGLMFKYHMNVTQIDFLYTGGGKSFFECVFISYGSMFIYRHGEIVGGCFLAAIIMVTLLRILSKSIGECDFLIMFWILLAMFGIAQLLFRRGYATGRELIPFYPLVVFAAWNGLERIQVGRHGIVWDSDGMRRLTLALSLVICVFLMTNFVRKIKVDSTREWHDNYGRRENVIKQFMVTDGDWTQMEDFGAEEDWFYLYKLHDICYGEE